MPTIITNTMNSRLKVVQKLGERRRNDVQDGKKSSISSPGNVGDVLLKDLLHNEYVP